jgi:hypothetical protein
MKKITMLFITYLFVTENTNGNGLFNKNWSGISYVPSKVTFLMPCCRRNNTGTENFSDPSTENETKNRLTISNNNSDESEEDTESSLQNDPREKNSAALVQKEVLPEEQEPPVDKQKPAFDSELEKQIHQKIHDWEKNLNKWGKELSDKMQISKNVTLDRMEAYYQKYIEELEKLEREDTDFTLPQEKITH